MTNNPVPQDQNPLEQIRALSTVVADTGEIDEIARVHPTDATTNPSLVLAAAPACSEILRAPSINSA